MTIRTMFHRFYVNFMWSPQKSKIGVYCSYWKEWAVTQLNINRHNRMVIHKAKEKVSADKTRTWNQAFLLLKITTSGTLINFYDNDQCIKFINMPPMYCPHLQSCPQHSAVFFFADFDSNLPTSSVSSHSFVHTEVVFLPIRTYKLSCTFITTMETIMMVGIATHNSHKMHVTYEWQTAISKSWFHTHTHTHTWDPPLLTIFNWQEIYVHSTCLLLWS